MKYKAADKGHLPTVQQAVPMKKSINAWGAEDSIGFPELFRQVKGAGFDGLELNIDREGHSAHSLALSTTPAQLEEIRALSRQYGLPVVSISSSLYGGKMGSPDREEREFVKALLRKQLECARALGSSGILAVPGGQSPRISLAEDFRRSQATLAELREDILEAGVYVGVENVWNGFFTSPVEMARFIDELDCPLVGAYFDVGNVVAFSWPESWIGILAGRIHHVHVKDFKRRAGLNRGGDFVCLAQGDVDWAAVIPALRQAGFDGYLTAEVSIGEWDGPQITYPDYYRTVAEAIGEIIKI